jgi:hypothetical protein
MMHWLRRESAESMASVLEVELHDAGCAVINCLDICTCGLVTKLALAEGSQRRKSTDVWPLKPEEE